MTVLWKLKVVLYASKADTTSRILVEVRHTSYGCAFSSLLSYVANLVVPSEQVRCDMEHTQTAG